MNLVRESVNVCCSSGVVRCYDARHQMVNQLHPQVAGNPEAI
jgi:hypothetical protein